MSHTKKIKLCFASPQFFPTYGGAQQRYLRYLPGLAAESLDVCVFAGTATEEKVTRGDTTSEWSKYRVGEMIPVELINGTPVHRLRLPERKGGYRRWVFNRGLNRFCSDPTTRPDVLHMLGTIRVGSIPFVKRYQRLGIPTLYSVTTASKTVRKKRFFDRRLLKFRVLFSTMDCVVANSPAVIDGLREMGVSTRLELIQNGVDLEKFHPARSPEQSRALRDSLGIGPDDRMILAVGAVMPRKGSDLLLDAWVRLSQKHPNAHLVFAGPRYDIAQTEKGEFRQRIEGLLRAAPDPDRVHFPGIVEDVPDYLRAADLFVLASRLEGMPNSVLEAMACAVPVVMTPFVGLSADLGRADQEYLLVDRNAEALAQGLDRLLEDVELRGALGRRGRCWVETHWPLEASVRRHAELYEQLVQARR